MTRNVEVIEGMLTEFEVRRRMECIQASRIAPLRKARLLLRLGRSLSPQVESLATAKRQIARTADRKATAGLHRMASNAARLREDLRDAAFYALRADEGPGIYNS